MSDREATAGESPASGAAGARPRPAPKPRRRKRLRGMAAPPEGTHRCMVLAHGRDDVVAVDLVTGGFVRLRTDGSAEEPGLAPFDVVDAVWATDPERDDLAQPEAVTVEWPLEAVGALGGRAAQRVLGQLVTPPGQHLLGFPGTSAPYWQFDGMRSSVAVVAPSRGPLLFRRDEERAVWARFGWPGSDNWLPVEDRRAVAALWAARREQLSGRDLAKSLGFRPRLLVATVSRPRDGRCYKTVSAILPEP